jgi:hypothetical protein
MNPKLSSDLEQFVTSNPTGAAKVEGTNGATYWLLTDDAMRIRQYVHEGLEQADRGEVAPWDAENIKSAGRQRRDDRSR